MHIRIEHLSKTYSNGTRALSDVSLEIPAGMFGLLGPNGAGKSTLMRILATLQEPDTGSAVMHDVNGTASIDVLRQKQEVRRTLGYLPQEFGLYPKVTARDLLDHFAVLKGITDSADRRCTIDALLEQTNLADARDRALGSFSGGMRQRFGIAIALIGRPRLLIVDEPTAGLDPAERVRFLNMLSELGENSVVVLSTHIVEDVSELCTHMAIIEKGTIRLQSEPLAAIAGMRGRIWRRMVERGGLAQEQRERVVISTKLFSGRTIVRVVADEPPGPEYEPAEPTLEDVYFAALRQAPAAAPEAA